VVTHDGRNIISLSTNLILVHQLVRRDGDDEWKLRAREDFAEVSVLSVAVMNDNLRFLVGGKDGTVRVHLFNGTVENRFSRLHRWRSKNNAEPKALVALPGDQGLALVGWRDGTVTLFDTNDGAILSTFEPHPPELRRRVLHTFRVTSLALMPGKRFVSGSTDTTTRITEYGDLKEGRSEVDQKAAALRDEMRWCDLKGLEAAIARAKAVPAVGEGLLSQAEAVQNELKVAQLEAMGFGSAAAAAALKLANGDLQAAVAALSDPAPAAEAMSTDDAAAAAGVTNQASKRKAAEQNAPLDTNASPATRPRTTGTVRPPPPPPPLYGLGFGEGVQGI
jgi:hypothetical protein